MLYYPIETSAGSGGLLIGVARIRRNADTYFPKNSYNSAFRNCSFIQELGQTGSLDSSNGEITPPANAKVVKISIAARASGHSGDVYSRILTDLSVDPDGTNLHNGVARSIYRATHHDDVEGAAWVRVNYYFSGENYTISGENALTGDEAIVEFYG